MTITNMIMVAKQCDRLDKLWGYWNLLETLKIKPDLVCYNSMLSGLSRMEDLKETMKFWRNMMNLKIRPDANSYSAVMSACVRAKRYQQVFGFAERMRQDNIALNQVTLGIL